MLRATDPEGLAGAWAMIETIWSQTVARGRELPEPVLHEQVDGEWSFVQTHRHLVLVTDCWLRRMVKGIAHPYHPWGLAGSWLSRPHLWGIDPEADPPLDQVLDVRRERMDEVREAIDGVKTEDLGRNCVPPPPLATRARTTLCCSACTWSSRRSGTTIATPSATSRCWRDRRA